MKERTKYGEKCRFEFPALHSGDHKGCHYFYICYERVAPRSKCKHAESS